MEELIQFLQSKKEAGDDVEQICKNLLIITKKNYGKLRKFQFSPTNHKLHYGGNLEERQLLFKLDVLKYIDEFGKDLCEKFYLKYSEPTQDLKKMLFETMLTWSTKGRLRTWQKNEQKWNNR